MNAGDDAVIPDRGKIVNTLTQIGKAVFPRADGSYRESDGVRRVGRNRLL